MMKQASGNGTKPGEREIFITIEATYCPTRAEDDRLEEKIASALLASSPLTGVTNLTVLSNLPAVHVQGNVS